MTPAEPDPRSVLLVAALALLGLGSPGLASPVADQDEPTADELTDEQREEAKRHFLTGSERFDDQRYREAIDHFEAAYEIAGSPEFLYNIGRCHEELGEGEEAVAHFEQYLRLSPEAEDADEVRARIERLRGGASAEEVTTEEAAEEATTEETADQEPPEWPPGLRLGVASGASFVLYGEWAGTMVPFDLYLQYPLLSWLFVTVVLSYGSYLEHSDTSVAAGKAKSQLGLFAGLSGVFELTRRVDLQARLGVTPTGVFRKNYETATWLAFQAGAGIAVWIYGGWGVAVEALGSFGPVFIADARPGDPWTSGGGPSPTADVGGRIGFYYAFD